MKAQLRKLQSENARLEARVKNLEVETAHQKALILSTIERIDILSTRVDIVNVFGNDI